MREWADGYAVAAAAASVTVSAAQPPATPHIYGTDTIGEANLNGTDANQKFIADANSPDGVAVDGTHVYWVVDKKRVTSRKRAAL